MKATATTVTPRLATRDLTWIALFAALTSLGAFIKIPVPYVPFTLQFFFVPEPTHLHTGGPDGDTGLC